MRSPQSLVVKNSDNVSEVDDVGDRQRALERSRSELVAWVGNDLRALIAGIRAAVESLDDEVICQAGELERCQNHLVNETDRLGLLLDDLLALSGVDTDALPTARHAPAAFDLAYRGPGEGATMS